MSLYKKINEPNDKLFSQTSSNFGHHNEWEKSAFDNNWNAILINEIHFESTQWKKKLSNDYNCSVAIKMALHLRLELFPIKVLSCTQQKKTLHPLCIVYARQCTEHTRINGMHSFISPSIRCELVFSWFFRVGFCLIKNRIELIECICSVIRVYVDSFTVLLQTNCHHRDFMHQFTYIFFVFFNCRMLKWLK